MTLIWKEFTFDSAHLLPNVPPGHKCGRLHGHTFRVRIEVTGEVCVNSGWVVDFADIKHEWKKLEGLLDHEFLNGVPGLENPTSENIAMWILDRMPLASAVEVSETCSSGARVER